MKHDLSNLVIVAIAGGATTMHSSSRRHFVSQGVVAAAGTAIATVLPLKLWSDPPSNPPGIQLYSVDAALTADVTGTLHALSVIGFKIVESAGFAGLSAKAFRGALDDAGLRCPSAHLDFDAADLSPLWDDANTLGAHYAVSSVLLPPGRQESDSVFQTLTLDDFKRSAERANSIGQKAKAAGLQFVYHNHNLEFRDQGNHQTGYDLLLRETDPSLVKFELDCGWMVVAGRNPVDYLKRYPDRYRMLHIKDFMAGGKVTTDLFGSDRPKGTELGHGFIDYKPIFSAAKTAGIEYCFAEQEPPVVGKTELEAAKINYQYLHSFLP